MTSVHIVFCDVSTDQSVTWAQIIFYDVSTDRILWRQYISYSMTSVQIIFYDVSTDNILWRQYRWCSMTSVQIIFWLSESYTECDCVPVDGAGQQYVMQEVVCKKHISKKKRLLIPRNWEIQRRSTCARFSEMPRRKHLLIDRHSYVVLRRAASTYLNACKVPLQ